MSARRGFTLLEMAITILVIGIVAAMAYPIIANQRPRANLLGTTTELYALLRNARQNALSTGRNTVVLFFPDEPNREKGTGRVIVVEDPTGTMFGATAPNFTSTSASFQTRSSNLVGELLFPPGITVGLGGHAAPTLPAPYASLPTGACTFCKTSGDHRGAIVFDYRGRARFYDAVGAPLAVFGGTIALQGADIQGFRMLAVGAATGGVFAVNTG